MSCLCQKVNDWLSWDLNPSLYLTPKSTIHSSIHLFGEYLLSAYSASGTIVDTGDGKLNKRVPVMKQLTVS